MRNAVFMRTIVFVVLITALAFFCQSNANVYSDSVQNQICQTDSVDKTEANVYICTGPQSKRYHKTSSCKGLSNCSGQIKKVTPEEAKKMNRTPCKICY